MSKTYDEALAQYRGAKATLDEWRKMSSHAHNLVVADFNQLSVDDRLELLFRGEVIHAHIEHGALSPFKTADSRGPGVAN
jgi:hypothetical protein